MKRRICWLLCLCMLCALAAIPAQASGEAEDQSVAIDSAKGQLTEVCGYTQEEADNFTFQVTEDDEQWHIAFAPKDHTTWVYHASFWKNGGFADSDTPFVLRSGSFSTNYPGEATVRDGLRTARNEGWFTNWNAQSMQAMTDWMTRWGFMPDAALTSGLAQGTITVGQTIQEYFVSCYGDETGWSTALKEWRDEELAAYGVTVEKQSVAFTGVRSYAGTGFPAEDVTVTEYSGEFPDELRGVLAHPKLEGWTALCGAYRTLEISNGGSFQQSGLMAFEKDSKRLLIVISRDSREKEWTVDPVSEQALYVDHPLYILADASRDGFRLCYPISDTETEQYTVELRQANSVCEGKIAVITEYRHSNDQTGESVLIDGQGDKLQADAYWFHVLTATKDGSLQEELYPASITSVLNHWNIDDFPKTAEECSHYQSAALADDVGVTFGVHLREKTSSHSKDLGMYNAGVLVRILDEQPGDPDTWLHVRVGNVEGYMSSIYVDYASSDSSVPSFRETTPLPVGVAKKEVALKQGRGLFDATVQTLPAGTKMYVLATVDDWVHVMVPQGELGWRMELDGTDGYLKANDVALYATSMQADWAQ